jgi:hypothetical protein
MARDPQVAAAGAMVRSITAGAASALTLEATANLVEETPVDTGHARRNWVPGIGAPQDGEPDTGAAQAAGMAEVAGYKLGDGALSITNRVPYIGPLLGGHSDQAPAGWDLAAVDRAVQTIQRHYDSLRIDVTTSGPRPSVVITRREGEP